MSLKTRPCEICNALIDPERIEAVPETRLCKTHATQIVKYGGEFLLTASPERTSKVGSLKHNYGGVNIQKQRNTEALRKLKTDHDAAQKQNAASGNA